MAAEYRDVVKGGRAIQRNDFKHTLYTIGNKLQGDDLQELKFLCSMIPVGKLDKIRTAEQLFEELERHKKLLPDNTLFLLDSLRRIQRFDLADDLERCTNSIKVGTCDCKRLIYVRNVSST